MPQITDHDLSRLRNAVRNPRDCWTFVPGDPWALLSDALEELETSRKESRDYDTAVSETMSCLYQEDEMTLLIKELWRLTTGDTPKPRMLTALAEIAEKLEELDASLRDRSEHIADVLK